MFTARPFLFTSIAALSALAGAPAQAAVEAIVSVKEQKVIVVNDGATVARFPVSTSKFGLGDSSRSYKTPLGKMKVCEKIGDELAPGAVLKGRHATGEVLPVNAPGRDPIVTRILWLDGCESQNANARERAIYIHGTPEESQIGKPASYGCIRMRSKDVIALYEMLPVGALVTVVPDKLPKLPKYVAPPPVQNEPPALLAKKQQSQAPIAAHVPAIAPTTKLPPPIAEKGAAAKHEPIAAAEAPARPKKSPPVNPAIASATIRTTPMFAPPGASARSDLARSMQSSILHSGLEDRSVNSEVPRLGW